MDRNANCALCGCPGQHADTTAGEIVVAGQVAGHVPDGVTILMSGRDDGTDTDDLYCETCARCVTVAQQFHRLLKVRHITRQRAADACGVSLATVHSWLRSDTGGRREMPDRMLRLLRLELGV